MKIFLIISAVVFFSFSPEKKIKRFENGQFVLECPDGWRMRTSGDEADLSYSLHLSAKGLEVEGTVDVYAYSMKQELEDCINVIKSVYELAPIFKRVDINYSKSRPAKFNEYPALATAFYYELMGMKSEGIIIALQTKDHTLCFHFDGAKEDLEENAEAFQFIEDHFIIK